MTIERPHHIGEIMALITGISAAPGVEKARM